MCVLHKCLLRRAWSDYEYWLMAVTLSFYCKVIICELARRGVRRGEADAIGSGAVQRV